MYKNENGFTLIEMLIVMSIIALLLILITPKLADHQENITKRSDEAVVGFVNTQIQTYYLDHHHFPADFDALITGQYIEEGLISSTTTSLVFTDTTNKKVELASE